MKALTRSEAENWCALNGVRLRDHALPARGDPEASFRLPQDVGARVAVVKTLMSSFEDEQEFLVWFDDWSVWPSGERMHIFDRFRLSYGEDRRLAEAPAHLFTKNAFEQLYPS